MPEVHSILESVRPADIRDYGFPAIAIPNALPHDYYEALERTFPSVEKVTGGAPLESNVKHRWGVRESLADPGLAEIWKEFLRYHASQDFFREFCALFGDAVARTHPGLERNFGKPLEAFSVGLRHSAKADDDRNASEDVMVDLQFSWNTPVREESRVRGPHLDSPVKLFAGLLYFRHEADDSTGGDLEFYRLRRGTYPRPKAARIDLDEVEPIERVPYAGNTLVLFVNSPRAIHGPTERSVTETPRRYMNFVAECYRGRIPDFFTAPETRSPYWWRQLRRAVARRL